MIFFETYEYIILYYNEDEINILLNLSTKKLLKIDNNSTKKILWYNYKILKEKINLFLFFF